MARRFFGALRRRDFVTSVGVAGGALLSVASGAIAPGVAHARVGAHVPGVTPEASALFGPITPGAQVERWQVVSIHGPTLGGITVVMATGTGARFQVDVLRRDQSPDAPAGIGHTPSLTCFLSNRGTGSTATDEEKGLGAIALAAALSERELNGAAVPPLLLTLRERHARFPRGVFGVDH